MPLIMHFYCFKAFKALSYWVLYYFTHFSLLVQKNPKPPQKTQWVGLFFKKTGFLTLSVMHGQCDTRPTVTFPAAVSPPFGRYHMVLLRTEAHACEQLAQHCYLITGVESATLQSEIQSHNHWTTKPHMSREGNKKTRLQTMPIISQQ